MFNKYASDRYRGHVLSFIFPMLFCILRNLRWLEWGCSSGKLFSQTEVLMLSLLSLPIYHQNVAYTFAASCFNSSKASCYLFLFLFLTKNHVLSCKMPSFNPGLRWNSCLPPLSPTIIVPQPSTLFLSQKLWAHILLYYFLQSCCHKYIIWLQWW